MALPAVRRIATSFTSSSSLSSLASTRSLISRSPCLECSLSRPINTFGSPKSHLSFSTSSHLPARRDRNKLRGQSALRRKGPKKDISVSGLPLPEPVTDASERTEIETDEDHPLWGFFGQEKTPISTPEQDAAHGKCCSRIFD
jgi:hypothetical protein